MTTDPRFDAPPSRSLEIELTFDVEAETPLLEWRGLPGITRVSTPELRELDAGYLDTADLALARVGVAVRRRRGGPDEGWHIKGPLVEGARVEMHWPLADDDAGIAPAALVTALGEWIDPESIGTLAPIARILNDRVVIEFLDEHDGVVVEFADDHVTGLDVRAGTQRTWREWEFELGPASGGVDTEALFAALREAAQAVGARPAPSPSKLARTLGH